MVLWLPACVALGGAVAWGAIAAQEYFAPAILFPLLTGVVLGALCVGMMRVGQVGNRLTILAGLSLAIATAVVGQHYLKYWEERQRTREEAAMFLRARTLFPDLTDGRQPVPPSSFMEYMRWQAGRGRQLNVADAVARGWMAWASWTLDALLLAAAAVAMTIPALRQPYCSRCRSWYRTTRSGRLSGETGVRLATVAGIDISRQPAWLRYRLIHCESACGPTGLLLFWEDSDGEPGADKAWLSAEHRDRITEFLDQNLPGDRTLRQTDGTGQE